MTIHNLWCSFTLVWRWVKRATICEKDDTILTNQKSQNCHNMWSQQDSGVCIFENIVFCFWIGFVLNHLFTSVWVIPTDWMQCCSIVSYINFKTTILKLSLYMLVLILKCWFSYLPLSYWSHFWVFNISRTDSKSDSKALIYCDFNINWSEL